MIEWIKCSDRMPEKNRAVIVYGHQMSSHWPDIAYAKWNASAKCWTNLFAYGGDELIRDYEVDFWLEIKLPEGLHE